MSLCSPNFTEAPKRVLQPVALTVARKPPKIVYLCGADWYFALHFIDLARGAKAAGYDVHVIAGVGERQSYAAQFEAEGFQFHPLVFARTGTSPRRLTAHPARLQQILRQKHIEHEDALAVRDDHPPRSP